MALINKTTLSENYYESWSFTAGHTHMYRGSTDDFEQSIVDAVKWANLNNINGIGIGSAWEPISGKNYGIFETSKRDEYYAGLIDPSTVMNKKEIFGLIDKMNSLSDGTTEFYIDNETPKNYYGHLWYIGFKYIVPGWHDYNQDKDTVFWFGEKSNDINSVTGQPHIRRPYIEVVAEQRANGAKAIWAHPTSWWWQGESFTTNIAAELVAHYHADGFLDGMVVMGYDAYHKDYQNLWFYLLDNECFAPAYAELDASFTTENYKKHPPMLSAYHAEYENTQTMIPTCITNGPLVEILDGIEDTITVNVLPQKDQNFVSLLEIIGPGGKTIISKGNVEAGSYTLKIDKSNNYLVARVWGENDYPGKKQQEVEFHAITNPIFFKEFKKHSPLMTNVEITIESNNINPNGKVQIVDPLGNIIDNTKFVKNKLVEKLPANSKIRIEDNNGKLLDIPLMMANQELRNHFDYLAKGKFLNDYEGLTQGQVPAEAFHFSEVKTAMQNLTIVI